MPLVILGRDGVINQCAAPYVRSPDEWRPIPGSVEAIARLHQAGYRVLVTTNQSGIGRGILGTADLSRIHLKLCQAVEAAGGRVDGIFFCPHQPQDECNCRKPRPGLFLDIARRLNISLADVLVVGDAPRDVQAARAVGAKPILLRSGDPPPIGDIAAELADVPVFPDLAAFVDDLLGGERPRAD
jgi:D-glycero-D-manno-heptose 1,7-bisphosphate phosphatase